MRSRVFQALLGALALAFLGGCQWPCFHDCYWRSERYQLVAVDSFEKMHLSFDYQDGAGRGLTEPTVFALGADKRYIVLKQHPDTSGRGDPDRSVTRYFVVERTTSPSFEERKKRIKGPMDRKEFQRFTDSLRLPAFTKAFEPLE